MNKSLKRVIVSAMALSLLVPAVLAPKAEAAAKPKLSAKSVKVTVGAKKKVTVKKLKQRKLKDDMVIAKERKENCFSFGKEKDRRYIKR